MTDNSISLVLPQVKSYPNGASNMYQAGNVNSQNSAQQLNQLTTKVGGRKRKNKQKGGNNNSIVIAPVNASFKETGANGQTISGNNQAINELYAKAQVNATYDNCASGTCNKVGGKRTKYSKKSRKSRKSKSKSRKIKKNKKEKKIKNISYKIKKSRQLGFII